MATRVKKEELQNYVGSETGVSDWLLIEQDRINDFADVTIDHQFIHVNEEMAAQTPFGSTIAHGFLTLSLLSQFLEGNAIGVEGTVMGLNYGFEKVRFLNPVKVNSKIRARVELAEVSEKPGNRVLINNKITIEIEGEKVPALVCNWLTMLILDK